MADQNFRVKRGLEVGIGGTVITATGGGNVGIGTTNPQYKLDVNGDINFNGSLYQNGSAYVASRWSAGNGNNIYRLDGNVGVGTTNPTSKLHVVGDTLVTGVVTATTFYGDGSQLSGIIGGVGIQSSGVTIGTGITTLNFLGAGNTFSVIGNTVNISIGSSTQPGKTSETFVATEGQTTFTVTGGYSVGFIDVFFNGIRLNDTEFTATNGTTVVLTSAASLNDVLDVVEYTMGVGPQGDQGPAGLSQWISTAAGIHTLSNVGIGSTIPTSKLDVVGDVNISGVVTASSFSGNATSATYATLAGVATYADSAGIATYATSAGIATALQNSRTFEITGDIVASPISFNGTGNVSLAATIQPNSVALGSDTTGDYVQTITGTSAQITVTSGTGEGSTPTLSIPSQFTAPQDVTVTRDLQVNRNLNVNGNITIGGTAATLFTTEFKVYDPDIVLGFRTDALGNDISTDNTANHGGIAIASTEGNPLVQLYDVGIGETNPATYKKIMWFKANTGSFTGLGTDAWLFNYAVGIGSTQFPTGTRLAAGSVQFTERDLAVVRNINALGVVTASSFSGNASSATYATSAGVSTSVIGGIASVTQLSVSGISTFTSGPVLVGTATSTGTASQPLQVTGGAYVSGNLGVGTTNPTSKLYVVGDILITGVSTLGITTITNLTSQQINVSGISTFNGITTNTSTLFANQLSVSGVSTFNGITTVTGATLFSKQLNVSGISTFNGITTNTSTLFANQLSVAGISTFGGITTNTSTLFANQLSVAGISTFGGITTVTGATLFSRQLNVSGVSTFNGIATHTAPLFGTQASFTGVVTATDFNSTSDYNLKTNIKTIENSLDTIVQLRGVTFDWKDSGKPSIGIVAQELSQVLPELVTDTNPKTVNYNGIIGVLIEAVKSQQEQINTLKEEIKFLREK